VKTPSLTLLLCAAVAATLVQPAFAHEERFRIFEMSGALENPVNASLGTGSGLVTFDLDVFSMRVQAEFSGLTGTTTLAHIHCCDMFPTNAIVATQVPTFTGFPAGVTAGSYDHTFDMALASSYNPAFVTAHGNSISQAFEDLLNAARAGDRAYLNIHTSFRSGGEIRGYLVFVPEPSSLVLAAVALSGLFLQRRKR
jgi:hypothetical protein